MTPLDFDHWLIEAPRRCLVMGVLNVTPNSFSDGGKFADSSSAVAHAEEMIAAGADLLDIGGESTRPGSDPVSVDEQIRRVVPVIEAVRKRHDIALSIDTTRAAVAEAALDAGACFVNDIAAGTDDPGMLPLVAKRAVPIVLMHMRGTPKTMQQNVHYENVLTTVTTFLQQRMDTAQSAGIAREKILLDPGIGFGKGMEHNLKLMRHLAELRVLNRPLLLGVSRKSFIGRITGESEPSHRLFGTAASVGWCVANGADIVRVHDVGPMRAVVKMIEAIATA